MGNRWTGNKFIYPIIFVAVVFVAVIFMLFLPGDDGDQVDLTTILAMAENGEITSIVVDGDRLIAVQRLNDRQLIAFREPGTSVFEVLHSAGIDPVERGIEIAVRRSSGLEGYYVPLLSFIFFVIVLVGIGIGIGLLIRRS